MTIMMKFWHYDEKIGGESLSRKWNGGKQSVQGRIRLGDCLQNFDDLGCGIVCVETTGKKERENEKRWEEI